MEPEQKAKELIEKSLTALCSTEQERKLKFWGNRAKQCAVICVEEIIKEQSSWVRVLKKNDIINDDAPESDLKYWQSVLTHLK